jgi:tetraacyldisaccharide 4'-kinase
VTALRPLLVPLSWLYGLGVITRNRLYDIGLLKSEPVAVPVVSVGNCTAGGSGKTPFVEYCAAFYTGLGLRTAVLSRGYGRTTSGFLLVADGSAVLENPLTAGDEPYQIAKKFPTAIVAVDEDRVRGARAIIERFHPAVILLDDGYQHRKLARTLDVVIIGAGVPLHENPLLPAGLRREPLASMKRADLIVWNGGVVPATQAAIRPYTSAPSVSCRYTVKRFVGFESGDTEEAGLLAARKLVDISGIAQPAQFRKTLAGCGIVTVESVEFPDHHRFSAADIGKIVAAVRAANADGFVTTEKDAVRLQQAAGKEFPGGIRGWYTEIGLEITQNAKLLQDMLRRAAGVKE